MGAMRRTSRPDALVYGTEAADSLRQHRRERNPTPISGEQHLDDVPAQKFHNGAVAGLVPQTGRTYAYYWCVFCRAPRTGDSFHTSLGRPTWPKWFQMESRLLPSVRDSRRMI
jgi:hypothetical protein